MKCDYLRSFTWIILELFLVDILLLMTLSSTVVGLTQEEGKLLDYIRENKLNEQREPISETDVTNVAIMFIFKRTNEELHSSMHFRIYMHMIMEWRDSRLINLNLSSRNITNPMILREIWMPELFFYNRIYDNITIFFRKRHVQFQSDIITAGVRVLMDVSCTIELQNFPFDTQTCSFYIHPDKNKYNIKLMPFMEFPLIRAETDEIFHQFTITGNDSSDCFKVTSCIKANYYIKRRLGFYLINDYIPSMLIVILSWASFWMDVNAIIGRTAFSLTALLTMNTKVSALRNMTAAVSYTKALDIWMMGCTGFIFISLWQSFAAEFLSRSFVDTSNNSDITRVGKIWITFRKKFSTMDKISRIAFPVAFVIFNIIYWSYYSITTI